MKVFTILFTLLANFFLPACNSTSTSQESIKEQAEEQKAEEMLKSDQERIDSFKNANGL